MCCRSSLTSLVRFMRFLLRKPSVLEALAYVLSTCVFHVRLPLTLTPKYLALSNTSRTCPCSDHTGFLWCLLLVHIWMTRQFWGSSHLPSVFPDCQDLVVGELHSLQWICLYSSALSENNLVSLSVFSGRSLLNARNNSGPSTYLEGLKI